MRDPQFLRPHIFSSPVNAMVSVVVRSLGRPSLGAALASVARQTYREIEVVVVAGQAA